MMRILRDAVKLDIYDLNVAYSSERFGLLSLPLQWRFVQKGVLLRGIAFFWNLLRYILHVRPKLRSKPSRGQVLFFAATKNQWDALYLLHKNLPDSRLIGIKYRRTGELSLIAAHLIALFFLPILLLRMIGARDYQRTSYSIGFDTYWFTYGYYIISRRFLHRWAPASIVIANDHVNWTTTLAQAARDENIPTLYIQHASVTENFPSLSFDYTCLEGRDALLKYDQSGPSRTMVFLTGAPKFDQYHQFINKTRHVKAVGICTNKFDTLETVETLCQRLHQKFPYLRYVLRPHPSDERIEAWQELAWRYGMDHSDSRMEASFEYLKGIDAIIAGETNILLEGALLNVYPIYYDYENIQLDFYGFLRNGLVEGRFNQPEQLCQVLSRIEKQRPDVRERAKFYCETIGTPYDGRSTELCSRIIAAVSSGSEINITDWEAIPDLKNLQAYRHN